MSVMNRYSEKTFDAIRHLTEDGNEFWYARELQHVLEYSKWENFQNVIEKAKLACENSNINVEDHFPDARKMIELGKGAKREIEDIMLTRYACYLILQNSDPRKEIVALGQTYFAVKTREREIDEEFIKLEEDEKRVAIRGELRHHNKSLAEAAKQAGVKTRRDYAIFQNRGYQGLYGGLKAKDIHERKKLKKGQQILDHMGSTELAANLFRATQTDEKLRRENISDKSKANQTHFEVGSKVRKTIQELGGTMPEDLPTPETSVKELEKQQKPKELNSNKKGR